MTSGILDRYPKATAGELAAALAAGEVSALELARAAIARIEALDPAINAVVVRDFDRGLAAAAEADARLKRGERAPLLGVPMTVKESFNVAGLPTTWGVKAFEGWMPDADAVAVKRLKGAGAVLLGKTNVPPFLADWQSDNPIYGRTNHPLDPLRTPGGSSGGAAAAVASGMVPIEFGSDIGGSIRVPAGFCGIYGHKPTFGLVPSRGQSPPGTDGVPPRLAVVGPLARSPEDLSTVLDIVAGPDEDEAIAYSLRLPAPRHETIGDFRVLVIGEHPAAALDSEIAEALEATARSLEAAGAMVSRHDEALPDLATAQQVYSTLLMTEITRGAPPQADPITAHAWMEAVDAQLAIRRRWRRLFEGFDAVLAPVMGVTAFPHDQSEFNSRLHTINGVETPYPAQVAWPGIATLANLPATAIPVGETRAGLPIGLQIIGPHLEDRTPLALARLIRDH